MNGPWEQFAPNRHAHRCAHGVARDVEHKGMLSRQTRTRGCARTMRPYGLILRFPRSRRHQFEHLVRAVEREHPSKAASMREWSIAAQHGLLLHLASMHDQHETAAPFELWEVRKSRKAIALRRCVFPSGVDLRLFEGADFAEAVPTISDTRSRQVKARPASQRKGHVVDTREAPLFRVIAASARFKRSLPTALRCLSYLSNQLTGHPNTTRVATPPQSQTPNPTGGFA